MPYHYLKEKVESILKKKDHSVDSLLNEVCENLKDGIEHYDWVGYYFADHRTRTLHLKAYAGLETDHTIIPFGKGICGQVAESNNNFVVPDVNAQNNYISCNINVKSEIVVPLFKDGKNIGQIDIDSNTIDPFSKKDELFLEWVNEKVSEIL